MTLVSLRSACFIVIIIIINKLVLQAFLWIIIYSS